LSFAYKRIVFINIYVARGIDGTNWASEPESRRRRCGRLCRSLRKSRRLAAPIIKISIMLAAAFSPGGTSVLCVLPCPRVSSLDVSACACVCCLPPPFVPASAVRAGFAIYARRRSRPERRLKCNRRKERGHGRIMMESWMVQDFVSGILYAS